MPLNEVDMAVMNNELGHIKTRTSSIERSLLSMDDKVDEILLFVSAQEQRNLRASDERKNIFRAATLLPVAILTAVVTVGVNYIMRPASPSEPKTTKTETSYILPTRHEHLVDEETISLS